MRPMVAKLKSRKFIIATVTMVLLAFSAQMGLDLSEDQILGIVTVAASYCIGQGYADGKTAEVAVKAIVKAAEE